MSKKPASKVSRTDWKRVDALRDEDIDLADNPELTPEMFARAVARRGLKPLPGKRQVTLRIDADVLEWFRAQGRGYQTRINALLRAYVDAHRPR
ncbi:MAG: BrnA antitoxin family protein [Pseudomonadota bacterium]